MTLPAFLFDLACLAILILTAAWYARKGFLAGVISFFGTLAALVISVLLARWLAPILFDSLFRPGLEESITAALAQHAPQNLPELLQGMLGFLPADLVNAIAETLGGQLNFAAPDIARQVVTTVIQPLVVPFIVIVAFFLLFLLLKLLLWFIKRLAIGVGHVPGISLVNKALGAVMGVFIGALYVFLLLCLLWAWDALAPETSPGLLWFSNSVTYRLLYGLNFMR